MFTLKIYGRFDDKEKWEFIRAFEFSTLDQVFKTVDRYFESEDFDYRFDIVYKGDIYRC